MKKVVVLLKNGNDLDLILKSYMALKNLFKFEIVPIYIRDIAYKIPISETVLNSGGAAEILNEMEDDFIAEVHAAFKKFKIDTELLIQSEVGVDEIKNLLKTSDLLMLEQDSYLNDLFLDLLKIAYRPIIVLRNTPLTFDNISIISNDGVKVNNSVYSFLNLFPELLLKNVPILTWNCNYEKHYLVELLENKGVSSDVVNFNSKDDTIKDFYFALNKFNLVIMGNLSRSFFFEKITNRTGINLLENLNTSIFIA
ncbi:hypothetical protein [Candidatus Cetobacterium colombiensis]|jgi:hypothetical protein|uniref:UspA domain-containing protein n=1 Tax=Candidatus Cetobacterium colombiensis TaxID=3073100 RepID=A0ABU4W901_9FUSO|nr:hypothetical protein [Candidatus Cetobacterium colombiensis]MDX8335997.1 hypothetical protein [Candidatus Cetobacterium colombiensis]